jgi:hypothetical protein
MLDRKRKEKKNTLHMHIYAFEVTLPKYLVADLLKLLAQDQQNCMI